MPSQVGVELYTSQSVPPASRLVPQARERYIDQHIWFTDQLTGYTQPQIRRLSDSSLFLETNLDDLYKQRRPTRDFTPQLQILHRYYAIMDDDRPIIELLQEEPELHSLLLDAVEPLRQAFGDKRLIYIRVQTCDEDSILKVAVRLPANFDDDPECALQAFDEAWWLKNCHRSGGALVFDYEMQNAV
jgi:hypothetical protein